MYKLTLPIYYTKKYKNKKDKTFLVALNWYRNAHHFIKNEVKKHYHELVISSLSDFRGDKIKRYRVRYKLYYKRSDCDLGNVISVIDKFLNDALQELEIVEDDNVKNYLGFTAKVEEQDKENPRIEVIIEELI